MIVHRGFLLSFLVIFAIIGAVSALRPSASDTCVGQVAEARRGLEASTDAIRLATDAGPAAQCAAYRQHAEALDRSSPVFRACGPMHVTRGSAKPDFDTEIAFYKNLVNQRCS